MSKGTRGKLAEAKVRATLVKLALNADFNFERFPDARSGSFKASPCDFIASYRGKSTLVEVKEVEHDFLLPAKNFSLDARARMRRWAMAGSNCIVLVYHSTTKLWRCVPLGEFTEVAASYNLSNYPTYKSTDEMLLPTYGNNT
jgi:penicillin-binding protein-related factor A (putative recombinase)